MKVCQYCDTVNPDDVLVCNGCGANEFFHKCNNCGTVFEGSVCPDCRVRANTEAAVCPDCGRKYYASSCPHCGYSPVKERQRIRENERAIVEAQRRAAAAAQQASASARQAAAASARQAAAAQQAAPKRHTFLWVLGWLFIFPLPLTILLMRKKSGWFLTILKLALLLVVWVIYFCAAVSGQSGTDAAAKSNEAAFAVYNGLL